MRGFVDIHSHWLPGIDDGARSPEQSLAMLRALGALGFELVCATPHMRAGMFFTTRDDIEQAFAGLQPLIAATTGLPAVALACEHHLDDVTFERLLDGQGVPYPAGRTALIELPYDHFPARLAERLFELRCRHLRPVLAHPERYLPVRRSAEVLDPLLDGGTVLQLDVGALAGQHGRAAQRCAEELTDGGYYYAASSDLHDEADSDYVARGIRRLVELLGEDEAEFLLVDGPRSVLDGQVED